MTDLAHLPKLISENLEVSTSEARRLIAQGGVRVDGVVTDQTDIPLADLNGAEVRVGRRWFRVGGYTLFLKIGGNVENVHELCMVNLPLLPLPLEERRNLRLELRDSVLIKYRLRDSLPELIKLKIEATLGVEQLMFFPGDLSLPRSGLAEESKPEPAPRLPRPRPLLTHTSTFTTLFGTDDVNESVGAAYEKLNADFEKRKEYMTDKNREACETRLGLLRHTWDTMLDRAD